MGVTSLLSALSAAKACSSVAACHSAAPRPLTANRLCHTALNDVTDVANISDSNQGQTVQLVGQSTPDQRLTGEPAFYTWLTSHNYWAILTTLTTTSPAGCTPSSNPLAEPPARPHGTAHLHGSSSDHWCPAQLCPPDYHLCRRLPRWDWRPGIEEASMDLTDMFQSAVLCISHFAVEMSLRHPATMNTRSFMRLSRKPKPKSKLQFFSQNLPKPTDDENFGTVTTLLLNKLQI